MARQLRLSLRRAPACGRAAFVTGPSNAAAAAAIDAWPAWRAPRLVLVGPAGVGKSHLARAWAQAAGAAILDREDPHLAAVAGRPVLVEDVDRGMAEEPLFHLINLADREGGGLLLTARTTPSAWPCRLPDLRSRLNALPVAEIEEPDDQVLEAVLRRLFEERSLRPSDDLYPYLLRRMERSAVYARELVRRLDEAAADEGRPVSRALARQLLDEGHQNVDLFE